jgi:hypothetical protein
MLTVNIIDFVASKENQTLVATYGNQTFSEELGEENVLFD